jgi:Folate-dependent phosphoribosylglycinamide formyltransferase PurN
LQEFLLKNTRRTNRSVSAKKFINLHPSLLPKYGGKGMYGNHVHEAVIANKERQTGITIHYLNEHYDEGNIIFQATCEVNPNDTITSLKSRVNALELEHFPSVIEQLLSD